MKKKDYYNYLILTGIVFVIYMILTHFTNVFGSDTDWINQHTIIPDYFRQLFYKTGNLIPSFSFNYGGGQNIFNLSYYGFLSPIILPSYLLPFVSMKTYMTVVDFIIVVSSGILQHLIRSNGNLYRIGQHGPDILFYYFISGFYLISMIEIFLLLLLLYLFYLNHLYFRCIDMLCLLIICLF